MSKNEKDCGRQSKEGSRKAGKRGRIYGAGKEERVLPSWKGRESGLK